MRGLSVLFSDVAVMQIDAVEHRVAAQEPEHIPTIARLTLRTDGDCGILRIESASLLDLQAWNVLRFMVVIVEYVLDSYPGIDPDRYFIEIVGNGDPLPLAKAHEYIKRVRRCRQYVPSWIPPELQWFVSKGWCRAGAVSNALRALDTAAIEAELQQSVSVSCEDVGCAIKIANAERHLPKSMLDLVQHVRHCDSVVLSLSGKGLHDAAVIAVARALVKNARAVEVQLRRNVIRVCGADALAKAVQLNRRVQTLDLGWNAIHSDGARAFASALPSTSLRTLDLARIGDRGAQILGAALLDHMQTTLEALVLQCNQIGIQGAQALADAIQSNCSLIILDLRGNVIGDQGADAFANALKANFTLKTLNLSANGIGNDGASSLGDALEENETLERLIVRRNDDIGSNGLAALLDRRVDIGRR